MLQNSVHTQTHTFMGKWFLPNLQGQFSGERGVYDAGTIVYHMPITNLCSGPHNDIQN